MNPDATRLIDLATRGIDDNLELRLAAETELRLALEENPGGRETALAEAADSLEQAAAHPQRGWWRFVLLGLVLAISLPLLVRTAVELKRTFFVAKAMSSFDFSPSANDFPGLDARQRLLLFGAEDRSGAEKWLPLWQSDPDHPAFLAQYAMAYVTEHDELSPEIVAAAERIDPGNGWFSAFAASGIVEGAVSKVKGPSVPRGAPRPTPVWKIDDRMKLDAALAAIHALAGKPKFTAYQEELQRQRMALLPPVRDAAGQISRLAYAFTGSSATIRLRKLADILAAGAQVAAAENDVEVFRRIVADWRMLSENLIGLRGSLVDGLVAKVVMVATLPNFRDAATSLGLADEAARFSDFKDLADKDQAARWGKIRPAQEAVETAFSRRGSVFAGMSLPMVARQVHSPPSVTDADLRPGRYADHALLARAMGWAGWLILGICAGAAALSRVLRNGLARRLAERMWNLFKPADWAWTIGGGVIFPVVYYLVILRLTPLSAWEWSARATAFIQPGAQFGFLVLAMILLPVSIASARLARRGAVLGLAARFPWLGWLACAAALAGIPACGGVMLAPVFQKISIALAGVVAGWLLAGAGLSLLGHSDQALRRATLARLVWPAWVAGMLTMVALVLYFHSEERRWIVQDRIMEISPDSPLTTRYESQVAEVLRGELEDLLRTAGAPR